MPRRDSGFAQDDWTPAFAGDADQRSASGLVRAAAGPRLCSGVRCSNWSAGPIRLLRRPRLTPSVSPRRRGDPPPPPKAVEAIPLSRVCLPMRSRGRWIARGACETEGDGGAGAISHSHGHGPAGCFSSLPPNEGAGRVGLRLGLVHVPALRTGCARRHAPRSAVPSRYGSAGVDLDIQQGKPTGALAP